MIARAALLSRVSEHSRSSFTLVDLNEFVPECMSEIQLALNQRISATVTLRANLKPIPADELLLGQLLLELALNSQDAMRRGGQFTLEVETVTITQDDLPAHPDALCGEFIRLRASDTGCGMQPEVRPNFRALLYDQEKRSSRGLRIIAGSGRGRPTSGMDRVLQQVELRHAVRYLPALPTGRGNRHRCRMNIIRSCRPLSI